MHETLLSIGAFAMVVFVCAQPICLLIPFGKKVAKRGGFGPYREAPEGLLRAARSEIERLTEQLAKSEKDGAQKDKLIEDLWFKANGKEHPSVASRKLSSIRHARLAGILSIATASGIAIGAFTVVPSHAASVSHPYARPTMQVALTSGGESPILHGGMCTERYLLQADVRQLHVIRFDEFQLYWPAPFRKPDEFDLIFWLTQYQDQQVLLVTLN